MVVSVVERIISEVNGLNERDRILVFKKMEELYSPHDKNEEDDPLQTVFGIWKDYDIDKAKLREIAWK
jgi:hypothetical protein